MATTSQVSGSRHRHRRRLAYVAAFCALALVAGALSLGGSTLRAQSGAVIEIRLGNGTPVAISEQQIRDNSDVAPAHHAGRNASGEATDGMDTPQALSLGKLLQLAGVSGKYVEL